MTKTKSKIDLKGMTKAEARVAIAKDALKHLRANRIAAKQGKWVDTKGPIIDDYSEEDNQLKPKLAKVKRCDVCALGAIIYSSVMRFNAITCRDADAKPEHNGIGFDGMNKYLLKFFPQKQLELIEIAFEEGYGKFQAYFHGERGNAAMRFRGAESDDSCLRRIMHNIIENDGTFVP